MDGDSLGMIGADVRTEGYENLLFCHFTVVVAVGCRIRVGCAGMAIVQSGRCTTTISSRLLSIRFPLDGTTLAIVVTIAVTIIAVMIGCATTSSATASSATPSSAGGGVGCHGFVTDMTVMMYDDDVDMLNVER